MSHPEVDHKEGDVSTLQTGLKFADAIKTKTSLTQQAIYF